MLIVNLLLLCFASLADAAAAAVLKVLFDEFNPNATRERPELALVCYKATCDLMASVLSEVDSDALPVSMIEVPAGGKVPDWALPLPAPLLFKPGSSTPQRFSGEFSSAALREWLQQRVDGPVVPPAFARVLRTAAKSVAALRRALVAVENETQHWLQMKVPKTSRGFASKCVKYYYEVLESWEREKYYLQNEIENVERVLNDHNATRSELQWATARQNILASLNEALAGVVAATTTGPPSPESVFKAYHREL